ncbi:MAG: SnoaL-like domain-containing protein [Inquilinus sp.]|nr:SnoaL-like domain-containing protein [Inquilinus sp.]
MKKDSISSMAALAFFVGLMLVGQTSWAQQFSEEREAIDKARISFIDDYAAGRVDAIVAAYHDDATFAGTLQPFWLEGKGEILDLWTRYFNAWPRRQLKFRQPIVRLYGSTAVETGYMEMYMGDANRNVTTFIRYSITRVNEGGRWLIVNMNVSSLPGN